MQLLAGIAGQPSIANALTRFIPRAGDRSRRLAAVSYGIAGAVGVIVSGLYIAATHLPLGPPRTARRWMGLRRDPRRVRDDLVRVLAPGCRADRNPAGRVAPARERNLRCRQDRPADRARVGGRAVRHRRVLDRAGDTDRRSGEPLHLLRPAAAACEIVACGAGRAVCAIDRPVRRRRLPRLGVRIGDRRPAPAIGRGAPRCRGHRILLHTFSHHLFAGTRHGQSRGRPDRGGRHGPVRAETSCDNGRAPDGAARSSRGRRAARRSGPGAVALRGRTTPTTAPHFFACSPWVSSQKP